MSRAKGKISVDIISFGASTRQVMKHDTVLEAKDIHIENAVWPCLRRVHQLVVANVNCVGAMPNFDDPLS